MDTPVQTPKKLLQNKLFLSIVILIVLLLLAGGGWYLTKGVSKSNQPAEQNKAGSGTGEGSGQGRNQGSSPLVWQQTANGWQATGTPPSCPNPLSLKTPTVLTNVTSILYPGQVRGGNYKPHGGFRFDTARNSNETVTAPMDAVVVDGSRYLVSGETQYMFDFIAPCGIMYRIGHLLVLDSKYQKIADLFPAPVEGDSRTTQVNPQVTVTAGETIATAVGTTKGTTGLNVFFDFGVYDLRSKNQASQNSTWAANPAHDPMLAQHAVCWFDLLSAADATKVKSLPAGDPTSGKTSDYCK